MDDPAPVKGKEIPYRGDRKRGEKILDKRGFYIAGEGGAIHVMQGGGVMAARLYIASYEDIMTAPIVTLSRDGVESLIKELQRLTEPPKLTPEELLQRLEVEAFEDAAECFRSKASVHMSNFRCSDVPLPETIEERLARLEEIVLDDGGTCGPEIVGWWPGRDEVR